MRHEVHQSRNFVFRAINLSPDIKKLKTTNEFLRPQQMNFYVKNKTLSLLAAIEKGDKFHLSPLGGRFIPSAKVDKFVWGDKFFRFPKEICPVSRTVALVVLHL